MRQPARGEADRFLRRRRVVDVVEPQVPGDGHGAGEAVGQRFLLPPRSRRQQDALDQVDAHRLQRDRALQVQRGVVVRSALHRAPAVGEVICQHEPAEQLRPGRQLQGQGDVVLDLLAGGGLDDGDEQVLGDIAAIGGDLGGIGPRIVAVHDDGAAVGVRAGQVAQRQCVGGHVHADRLHDDDRAAIEGLRAVEHGPREGLIIVDDGVDALLVEKILHRRNGVEKAGDGGTRVPAEQMHTALRLQRALQQQFISGEDLRAFLGQESRINFHGGRHCMQVLLRTPSVFPLQRAGRSESGLREARFRSRGGGFGPTGASRRAS